MTTPRLRLVGKDTPPKPHCQWNTEHGGREAAFLVGWTALDGFECPMVACCLGCSQAILMGTVTSWHRPGMRMRELTLIPVAAVWCDHGFSKDRKCAQCVAELAADLPDFGMPCGCTGERCAELECECDCHRAEPVR